jgi:hypothetical protein
MLASDMNAFGKSLSEHSYRNLLWNVWSSVRSEANDNASYSMFLLPSNSVDTDQSLSHLALWDRGKVQVQSEANPRVCLFLLLFASDLLII